VTRGAGRGTLAFWVVLLVLFVVGPMVFAIVWFGWFYT